MIPIEGRLVLTAEEMRAAEAASGESSAALIERAGAGVADAVRRVAVGAEVLVLCGSGGNGGVGYVAAQRLRAGGVPVRVAAMGEPARDSAGAARAAWDGPVVALEEARMIEAPILVDALLGAGADPAKCDRGERFWWITRDDLAHAARYAIAADLPSGILADTGGHASATPNDPWTRPARFDLTLALGAPKPAHVLAELAGQLGAVRVVDLGFDLEGLQPPPREPGDPPGGWWEPSPVSATRVIARPRLPRPGIRSHKYSRGMVAVVARAMPGAAHLAAVAAARAGAGYVELLGEAPGGPAAIVHRPLGEKAFDDGRIGAVVVGPGLGRDEAAARLVDFLVTDTRLPLVIDGDALRLVDLDAVRRREAATVLTPHAGEYAHLFGEEPADGSPLAATRAAVAGGADPTGWGAPAPHLCVVRKGATTIVADAARTIVAPGGDPWLSTAGTGDVLAGTIGAMLAAPVADGFKTPVERAAAGVWLHAEAARACGGSFIADDLAAALSGVRGRL